MLSLTQRSFQFVGVHLTVACRLPPDELERITLTLQNDGDAAQCSYQGGSDGMRDCPDAIGLDLWPACLALCQYLGANPGVVLDQTLLELGAGMGLPGILCAKLGAQRVVLTDYEPLVLEQLAKNAELNGCSTSCSVQRLDWLQLAALPPAHLGCWRMLLAADVLYASVIIDPFVAALKALIHPDGVALVAHQIRRAITLDNQTRLPRLEEKDEPFEAFLSTCQQASMHVRILSSRQTCSNVDTDPMMLVAVGKSLEAVQRMPAWGDADSRE